MDKEDSIIKYNILTFIGNDKIFENSLLPKIINLYEYFSNSKFVLYICVNNKFSDIEKIDNLLKTHKSLRNLNFSYHIFETINKGADIGGYFELLKKVKEVNDNTIKYNIFTHTKSDDSWRESLLSSILTPESLLNFEQILQLNDNIGIYGEHRWLKSSYKAYHSNKQLKLGRFESKQIFENNFETINSLFKIQFEKETLDNYFFIAGTMFIFSNKLIEFIYPEIDNCYALLPLYDYWRPSGKDIIGFEYTFERWLGCLCHHLGLLVSSKKKLIKFRV